MENAEKTWRNIKPYMSDDTVEMYCKKCIARYQTVEVCRRKIMDEFMIENAGKFVSKSSDANGPAHVHEKDVYSDYRRLEAGKPDFVDFKFEELNDPMKLRYTLILLDWHMGSPTGYDFSTEEKWVRGWNGGPTGWMDHLTEADFAGKKDPKAAWKAHRDKIANTKSHWEKFQEADRAMLYFEEHGIAHWL